MSLEAFDYTIYRYTLDRNLVAHVTPKNISNKDLDRRLFDVVKVIEKGEVREVVCYGEASFDDPEHPQYSVPVLHLAYEYTRNARHEAMYRTETIQWYREDGQLSDESKVLTKTYTGGLRKKELKRRCENIVTDLESALEAILDGLGLTDAGQQVNSFFSQYGVEVRNWIDTQTPDLLTAIAADTDFPWFNQMLPAGYTIRQAALSNLTLA